jgi:hypothetical protein
MVNVDKKRIGWIALLGASAKPTGRPKFDLMPDPSGQIWTVWITDLRWPAKDALAWGTYF